MSVSGRPLTGGTGSVLVKGRGGEEEGEEEEEGEREEGRESVCLREATNWGYWLSISKGKRMGRRRGGG